jgi:hypothetical protein
MNGDEVQWEAMKPNYYIASCLESVNVMLWGRFASAPTPTRVGLADYVLDALPPVLECVDFRAVDQRLKPARLQRVFEPIRKGHIFARIGDEDSGFELDVRRTRGFRLHRRFPGSHVSTSIWPKIPLLGKRLTRAPDISLHRKRLIPSMSLMGQTRNNSK